MKGWKLIKPFTLEEREFTESPQKNEPATKVKITKALVTLSDILRYSGESEVKDDLVLGSYGIGVVTETDANLFGLEKGNHVFVDPYRPCKECYNCMNGDENSCSDLLSAGEDFDGFLRDFASVTPERLFLLPENVSDFEALFIGEISLAIAIVDKLGIKKGDYVAVLGATDFGIILSQLLIYYQAVPVLMAHDEVSKKTATESGIYYVLGPEDNWQKEVSNLTGGRMTKSVVYCSDSNIPAIKAFSLASFGAEIAFTGVSPKSNPVSLSQAVKKQLNIHCINSGFGNTAASINLIANKAINLSALKTETVKYEDVPKAFEHLAKDRKDGENLRQTVVDLM